MRTQPTALAYRTLFLGDLMTAIPALRGLRRALPRHRLVLAVRPQLARLANALALADLVVPTAELAVPAVREPEIAVDLHGNGEPSRAAVLATHPRSVLAFACPPKWPRGPRWDPDEHEVHRWCRMLGWYGVAADPSDLDVTIAAPAPDKARGATVIHPGASGAARRWPARRFAEVAAWEQAHGRTVVVTGSRRERLLAEEVAFLAGLPMDAVLAGRTPDALDLAAVVSVAGRVICGDTGTAHLATALGVPSVVLFGPVPPSTWGPPPERPRHRALWKGHRGDPHGEQPDPGLLAIPVDEVLSALTELEPLEV